MLCPPERDKCVIKASSEQCAPEQITSRASFNSGWKPCLWELPRGEQSISWGKGFVLEGSRGTAWRSEVLPMVVVKALIKACVSVLVFALCLLSEEEALCSGYPAQLCLCCVSLGERGERRKPGYLQRHFSLAVSSALLSSPSIKSVSPATTLPRLAVNMGSADPREMCPGGSALSLCDARPRR